MMTTSREHYEEAMRARKNFAKKAIRDLLIGRKAEIKHYQSAIDDSETTAQISRVLTQVRHAI